jgi:phage baseplate assembly protein W
MKSYKGFSTKNPAAINNILQGKDLVIEDIMNEIMTRKGERIMLPNYGCIIHDLIFEPLTQETSAMVKEDLERIIDNDPRIELLSDITLLEQEHSITATMIVKILPSGEVEQLTIDLERE